MELVKAWEENIIIPTYPVGKPDKNPMFLEKRVYQGSSGAVYPHPVIDKIYDEKTDKYYRALFLENRYLKIMILPELGGRVQMALDKTNDYHFVYYNQVIKPALVGLTGPWISGGIEFNWPQHHRPSTYNPVDFAIEANEDGSKTVWVSEIEKMFRTKGMAGFTLYPDKAYLEIKGKLYNRTSQPQTFLWWANPAVSVDEHYQSVFPPDVQAVFDHGKRDVSTFPIATGTYYKVDYSPGTDISKYKNIPVPTSYMAAESKYNFVGGYHHGKKAGILHVADHHISPGKKQWTWGHGDFGQAWDRNLTDEDGPYFELMTGVFTDNQPDFSWIQPYEEKNFTQYFFPYKELGVVKNANIHVLVNLEVEGNIVKIGVYVTSERTGLMIRLTSSDEVLFEERQDLSPEKPFTTEINWVNEKTDTLKIAVITPEGKELISYMPEEKAEKVAPKPAKPAPAPSEVSNNEQLYLTGLHLEQYRHATYSPTDYYLEALKRDEGDIRNNNAYGLWLFRKGRFSESEPFFRKAIETLIQRNPNPYEGEPYYNLGLSLKFQNKLKQAYDAFYKSIWNAAWQDSGYFSLAQIASIWQDYDLALAHTNQSLIRNAHNHKARHLKVSLLRSLKRYNEAEAFAKESINIDLFNFGALFELHLILKETNRDAESSEILLVLKQRMRKWSHNYIEISLDYAHAGSYREAIILLSYIDSTFESDPMVKYYLGYFYKKSGDDVMSMKHYEKASADSPDYCFPKRLEDILVLTDAIITNPADSNAPYFLGNLWYDKKQYKEAISSWEKSRDLKNDFPSVHRNLAIAYFNKEQNPGKAQQSLEKAFSLNTNDARVLFELDQLFKKLNKPPKERLQFLEKYSINVQVRDDLYLEKITLLNTLGELEKAQSLLSSKIFHPWEGGEGKVTGQYTFTQIEVAKRHLYKQNYQEAITSLEKTFAYPHNLGEGKLYGAQENDIQYYLGCAYEGLGDKNSSTKHFINASQGLDEPAAAMFYNDQPPEKIFYQGLALRKLEREDEAECKFQKLIRHGEKHLNDHITIDYFAVSLPDLLIFDDDLDKRNKLHCIFMIGLGLLGQKDFSKAKKALQEVLDMDTNHQGARIHLQMVDLIKEKTLT